MCRRASKLTLKLKLSMAAVCACAAVSAAPAEAQEQKKDGTIAAVEFAFLGSTLSEVDSMMISPVLSLRYRSGSLRVTVDYGAVYVRYSEIGGDQNASVLRSGNATLGIHYAPELTGFELRLGAALGLPFASIPDDDFREAAQVRLAYLLATGARGQWNAWWWAPEQLTLVIPARVGFQVAVIDVGIEAAAAAIGSFDSSVGSDFLMQLALEASMGAWIFTPGMRLQAVAVPTSEEEDDAQLSWEPFLRAALGSVDVQLRMTINLDDPFGFSFDRNRIWGLHAGAAGYF